MKIKQKIAIGGITLAMMLATAIFAEVQWNLKVPGATISCSSTNAFGWFGLIEVSAHKCHGCLVANDGAMGSTIAINSSISHVDDVNEEYEKCTKKGKRTEGDLYEWTNPGTGGTRVKAENIDCVER